MINSDGEKQVTDMREIELDDQGPVMVSAPMQTNGQPQQPGTLAYELERNHTDLTNGEFTSPEVEEIEDVQSTRCFLASIVALWIIAFLAVGGVNGLFFPIVFVPTAVCYWIWKTHAQHLVGLHSVVHAYALGFYTGALLVFLYKLFVLFFLFFLIWRNEDNDTQYWIFVVFFSILGEALGPEYMKFIIASKGRTSRPDLLDMKAYLYYSSSGALGFATFMVVLDTFFLVYSLDTENRFFNILLRVLIDIPLHLVTGYYIGIGVAKNEVFQSDISWQRIILLPVILRSFAEVCFYVGIAELSFPGDIVFAVAMYFLAIGITCLAIRRERADLPNSFAALGETELDEAPMPDTAQV